MRVIEYQHRGLPHTHMVVQHDNILDWKTEKEKLALCVDENINATYPLIDESSCDCMKNIHNLIKTHTIHKYYKGGGGCPDEKTGQCNRGFSMNFPQDHNTFIGDHGFRIY